ncbi:hypothetical protein [Stenotrophomonas rhizophila]|uniref:hypothetical protein n=1 Tax=Stenotrophomonas rhizophila TaxID=216778 RepID=UPI001E44433D|nr:hypothetical protein [Stenotrophomonas rhizophila]MCC7632916.1 hypothetical protein [Stenotrophomonas rhizophila]MCC7662359.1 hypothetical protein [Stenotrophomonas rhizophila]
MSPLHIAACNDLTWPQRIARHAVDGALLAAASIAYAGALTATIRTGHLGWQLPSLPYTYERSDLLLHAVFAAAAVLAALLLVDRLPPVRRTPWRGDGVFALAVLLVIRIGPPDARVFGDTWTAWEVTHALFLQQWPLLLTLTVAAVGLRRLARALPLLR